ncbi:MAG TPA: BlaI/MecI/CopY family transcriptional regulator [Parvularculaceae bacterium]|nr:BlaI/MecI/CopY family transcriptional regulator [Parvularculaceae bacterium]
MAIDPALQPTKPELSVLKLLWRKRTLSAREITDEVAPEFNWSYSTMRTVIERMCEKGLLKKKSADGINVYSAAVGKVALLSRMILDFSDRVLELDAAPSAVMFADSKLLSEEEIRELEKILKAETRK